MGRESRIISFRDLHLLLSESAYVLSDSVCIAAPSPASSRPTRCPMPPTHYRITLALVLVGQALCFRLPTNSFTLISPVSVIESPSMVSPYARPVSAIILAVARV